MEFGDDSTSESEDETHSCTLQYREVDPSLLGTAVFIRNVQIDPGDSVLLYVHQPDVEENAKPGTPLLIVSVGVFIALVSLIVISNF
jgi:hypothetical protein